jgi:SAM-dependent methyltransferase
MLASVAEQRRIESSILSGITADHRSNVLLSVGCAFGDELNDLLLGEPLKRRRLDITAIDLSPVGDEIFAQPFVSQPNIHLEWHQLNIFDLPLLNKYGSFDVAQVGFVLHDIDCSDKEKAFKLLAQALRPYGQLILSDIFSDCRRAERHDPLRRQVEHIYDRFLEEANQALRVGDLNEEEWLSLVGDGRTPGLKATRKEAIAGSRDFFESVEETSERLGNAGFVEVQVVTNPINSYLSVLSAQVKNGPPVETKT